jgi:large subunit ribosomal protein L5
MAVPRVEKVVLNMGLGEAIYNIKVLDKGVEELTLIAGQKAIITKAKRSIAGFKLRQGMPIGCTRGLSDKIFDGRANCTIGMKEQIIFPEIDYDKIDKIKGLNISIITTAKTDAEGFFLLKFLGMPFKS